MNRKQLICMWCGIAAIVFLTLIAMVTPIFIEDGFYWGFLFIAVLVTGSFIFSLKDKEDESSGDERNLKGPVVNWKRGLKRITLCIAILAGILGSAVGIVTIYGKYNYNKQYMRALKTVLEYYRGQPEAGEKDSGRLRNVVRLKLRLDEAEKGFWANLPKGALVGLCILAGIGCAAAGYCGVWLIYFFIK